MTSPTPPSTPPSTGPAPSGFINKFLDVVERVGNKLPDPAFLFLGALIIAWGCSAAFAGATFETKQGTMEVTNQLSGDALVAFMTSMVESFVGFHPVGVVLVAMLGFGVAEKTGYINAGLKLMLQFTPKMALTPMLVLVAIVSHTAADAGYVLVIPIGGVLFYAAGRHPLAGICAAFAGVSGGFSANFIPSAIDAILQGMTQESAQIMSPGYEVNMLCNYWFTAVSSIVVILMVWFLTDRVIEPRLQRQFPIDDGIDVERMDRIGDAERKGFIAATISVVIMLGLLVAACLPEDSPLRAPKLPDDDVGALHTVHAPLMQMIVPLLFVLALVPGVIHGLIAGTVKSTKDIVDGMIDAMKSMGHYLVIMFFAAQFVYVFSQSNLGAWMAISGAGALKGMGLPAIVTIIGTILLTGFVNLLLGSASAKWAMLSVILVPLLMELGISPEFAQAAYRVGDSTTNIITPLMPYFPLVVVYCQRYHKATGIGTLLSLMMPYSVMLLVGWTLFLVLYYITGVPLGFDGGYVYPPK